MLDHAEETGRWPTEGDEAAWGEPPTVVRAPEPGSRGVWDSWSAVATVGDDVVALTIGFVPLVGESRDHRHFVQSLIHRLAAGAEHRPSDAVPHR